MSHEDEKRLYPRHATKATVQVQRTGVSPDPSASDEFTAQLVNLSQGGVRIETRELIQPHETIHLLVASTATGVELRCTGVVRWVQKVTGGYQVGVEFAGFDKPTE